MLGVRWRRRVKKRSEQKTERVIYSRCRHVSLSSIPGVIVDEVSALGRCLQIASSPCGNRALTLIEKMTARLPRKINTTQAPQCIPRPCSRRLWVRLSQSSRRAVCTFNLRKQSYNAHSKTSRYPASV